jgi:hypothetical protein
MSRPGPVYRRLKNRARRRSGRRALKQVRERDDKEFERYRLPEGERLWWPCFWLAEVYTPSEASGLVDGLKRLGWSDPQGSKIPDVAGWVQQARSHGTLGRTSAGIFRPKAGTLYPQAIPLDMPPDFAFLHPHFFQVAPGLTVVIATFGLGPPVETALEDELRRRTVGEVKRLRPGGHSLLFAGAKKAEEIGELRTAIRRPALEWVSHHLPGAFSRLKSPDDLPVWDLLITRGQPLPSTFDERTWLDFVGLGSLLDQWTAEDALGLRLGIPTRSEASRPRPTFFGTHDRLVARLPLGHDDQSRSRVVQDLDDRLPGFLAIWAVSQVLEALRRNLSESVDFLERPRPTYRATKRQLERLREDLLPISRDADVLRRSCDAIAADPFSSEDAPSLRPVPVQMPGGTKLQTSDQTLVESLVQSLPRTAGEVASQAETTIASLRAYGELLLASTMLRLQRLVFWASILAVLIALASLFFTLRNDGSPTEPTERESLLVAARVISVGHSRAWKALHEGRGVREGGLPPISLRRWIDTGT